MVLRVDKEKGYSDLSRLFRVSQEEIVVCEERFDKSEMAHGVLRHPVVTSPAAATCR
jgi:translation initiation factor 2 subunit 1